MSGYPPIYLWRTNVADIMTKHLLRVQHNYITNMLLQDEEMGFLMINARVHLRIVPSSGVPDEPRNYVIKGCGIVL